MSKIFCLFAFSNFIYDIDLVLDRMPHVDIMVSGNINQRFSNIIFFDLSKKDPGDFIGISIFLNGKVQDIAQQDEKIVALTCCFRKCFIFRTNDRLSFLRIQGTNLRRGIT
ncbi:MAG: hypothetical protein PVG96_04820 [Desulfobacterales bacterium]